MGLAGTEYEYRSVWPVLSLCLQADSQNLLFGDLNMAQLVAKQVVASYRGMMERVESEIRSDMISDIIDLYLKLNFPDVWDEVEHARMHQEDMEHGNTVIYAEDMAELMDKMHDAEVL